MRKQAPVAPHAFDTLTDFCMKCGCSKIDEVNGFRFSCDTVGNVVGISHLLVLKRWKEPLLEAEPSSTEPRKA